MRADSHTLRPKLSIAATAVFTLFLASPGWAVSCEDMLALKLPNTEIKSARQFGAGEFAIPGRAKQPDFPAFCQVVASVKTSPDSDIGVEIWLPSNQWNGVFHGNGNGGYAGSLNAGYPGMEAGLRRGYA